jgi:predicted Fe-Mo cluster-binding NifX family protein
MRIVVTAGGPGLDAGVQPNFGRCPMYVFVDTETQEVESVENPALTAAGGAGIQGAQFVVQKGARAVITGNVGPNAFQVLQAAGVPIYHFAGGTVREALEAFREGRLALAGGATAPAHAGTGPGRGENPTPAAREEEIARLRQEVEMLQRQLREVTERLQRLEAK